MRYLANTVGWMAVAAATVACTDPLTVTNKNNPDIARAFSTPQGIEQLIATSYQQISNGVHDNNVSPQLQVMSLESYASVANFGMALRASIPRGPIQNSRGNQTANENFRDFSVLQRLSRSIASGIAALDKLVSGGGTLGSSSQNARARAFGFFTLGLSQGIVSLVYDSAAIVTPTTKSDEMPPLSSYTAVNTAALAYMDSAIAIANSAPVSADLGSFTSTDWIRGNTLSRDDFIRLVRSFKARLRANVARTPDERKNVNWDEVIADATNGLKADLVVQLSNSAGWYNNVVTNAYRYTGWHMMSPMYMGMADTSDAYDAWLATPMGNRASFLIKTPDNRFPAGDTRTAQQTASGIVPNPATGRPYFRNRPTGEDTPGDAFGTSPYDHYRFRQLRVGNDGKGNADQAGPWVEMGKAELDLLAAEGYLRKGNVAAALPLIDNSRVAAGLPKLAGTGIASINDKVPGGDGCVPRVPKTASGPTDCGTVWEAMKYEKRMESAFTGYNPWYFDSRGWGDLIEGTALQYPVPYQEMDARAHAFYDLGGLGGPSSAGKGTYGF